MREVMMSDAPADAKQVESSAPNIAQPTYPAGRLMSVDALRGFTMFWILGVDELVLMVCALIGTSTANTVAAQFVHVDWEGFVFEDLIFPTFIFIVGVSIVLSLGKLMANEDRGAAVRRVLTRSLVIYVLGLIYYYDAFSAQFSEIRLLGVLQRIALCYLFAGLLFCFLRLPGLVSAIVILLVGYWALMCYVPVPDIEPHSFAEGRNLANYIDAKYLPGFKWDGPHDPEGLLSTLPAIATCLLGVLAGLLLKNAVVKPYWKVAILLVAGVAGVALGYAWGQQFPVIKKIWTSSYVLVAGGYSAILLGVFYLLLDVWKWRWWATVFVWIGTNAIALYMLSSLVDFKGIAERYLGGAPGDLAFGEYLPFVVHVAAVALLIAVARFLYRRQVFIRA
jgi:predicted acyltransferase